MIVIKNAVVLNPEPSQVIQGTDIVIEEDRILDVGAGKADSVKADRIIDVQGALVFPGMVNAHNHLYLQLSRGWNRPPAQRSDLVSHLQNLWWKLDVNVDEDILRASAQTAALEAIRSGTTTLIDHHSSPHFIEGSLDVIADALEEIGLRGVLSYAVSDRNGREDMLKGIEENTRFLHRKNPSPLLEGLVGANALYNLPSEALMQLGQLVQESGSGIHIHVAEDAYDASHCRYLFGKDPMERLDQFGLLNSHSLIVMGVHLTSNDVDILNSRNASLVHCARANMFTQSGYNPYMNHIKTLMLGTDGIDQNMLSEMQTAYLMHRHQLGAMDQDRFAKALYNGNQILERLFDDNFGRIEKGYKADLVISSYRAPTLISSENMSGHLINGIDTSSVESVMINGKMVLENRRFPLDEEAIYQNARAQSRRLWEIMEA